MQGIKLDERKQNTYFFVSIGLILVGLAASVYLAKLYVQLNLGIAVDSFCAINERFNCVTVADCEYSTILGIPIAVYGIQFYAVLLAALLFSRFFRFPISNWPSFQFFLSALSIPASFILGWISVFWIESFCILCGTVYLVNILLFVLAGSVGGWRVFELLFAWYWELRKSIQSSRDFQFVFMLLVLVVVGQFFFLPKAFKFDNPKGEFISAGMELDASGSDPFLLGDPNAPVQIAEFTDFECPFCARAHEALLQVYFQYTGKIAIRHYDYPLDNNCNPRVSRPFHANACRAAKYAKCAGKQDKFWYFKKLLFKNQSALEQEHLDLFATRLKLDLEALHECVADPTTVVAIQKDIQAGAEIDVNGTPTFVVNGEVVRGMRPAEFWEQKVLELLAKAQIEKAVAKHN
jgi:protein-disulfide isomerase/uncharacterized membrane protein